MYPEAELKVVGVVKQSSKLAQQTTSPEEIVSMGHFEVKTKQKRKYGRRGGILGKMRIIN